MKWLNPLWVPANFSSLDDARTARVKIYFCSYTFYCDNRTRASAVFWRVQHQTVIGYTAHSSPSSLSPTVARAPPRQTGRCHLARQTVSPPVPTPVTPATVSFHSGHQPHRGASLYDNKPHTAARSSYTDLASGQSHGCRPPVYMKSLLYLRCQALRVPSLSGVKQPEASA